MKIRVNLFIVCTFILVNVSALAQSLGPHQFYQIYARDVPPRTLTRETLTNAITSAGTTENVWIVLDGGEWVIADGDVTVPSNIELVFQRGSYLSIDPSSSTVTVNTIYLTDGKFRSLQLQQSTTSIVNFGWHSLSNISTLAASNIVGNGSGMTEVPTSADMSNQFVQVMGSNRMEAALRLGTNNVIEANKIAGGTNLLSGGRWIDFFNWTAGRTNTMTDLSADLLDGKNSTDFYYSSNPSNFYPASNPSNFFKNPAQASLIMSNWNITWPAGSSGELQPIRIEPVSASTNPPTLYIEGSDRSGAYGFYGGDIVIRGGDGAPNGNFRGSVYLYEGVLGSNLNANSKEIHNLNSLHIGDGSSIGKIEFFAAPGNTNVLSAESGITADKLLWNGDHVLTKTYADLILATNLPATGLDPDLYSGTATNAFVGYTTYWFYVNGVVTGMTYEGP